MKKFETRIPEPKPYEAEVECRCDLCGELIPQKLRMGYGGEIDEVTVKRATGYGHSDGGHNEIQEFDICGKCFDEKLIPWVKSHPPKASPRLDETDW